MDATEQVAKFSEFFETMYYKDLLDTVAKGNRFLIVPFNDLAKFHIELAEDLLEDPENTLQAAKHTIEQMDLGPDIKGFEIRFSDLPKTSMIMVRDIRSRHINKLLQMEGIIRQKSDVRPQVTAARFECPACGNIIPVLQLDQKFKEPTFCACGRKGQFRLLHKELVDAQKIVLEEASEDMDGGEQPKRLNIFLKNDLVSPISDKRTNPGSKVRLTGIIKEVPIILATGGKSTRFDLMCDANFMEPVQEEFTNIVFTEDEIKKIKEEAEKKDKQRKSVVFDNLRNSLAPTIYGHDIVKQALLLQLFGGVQKRSDDGVTRRGDIHILLIGDPGAGKSVLIKRMSAVAPKSRFVSGKGSSGAGLCVAPTSLLCTNPGGMESIERVVDDRLSRPEECRPGIWKQENINDIKIQSMNHDLEMQSQVPDAIWKLESPEFMYEVTLRSGKKIELTANTQLFTLIDGQSDWKKSSSLLPGTFVATPRKLIGGEIIKQPTIDLVQSNPMVHNIKPFVKSLLPKLKEKFGSIRLAAKALQISENQLYHEWVNETARGNIKLNNLKKVCSAVAVDYHPVVSRVSLYNGKIHSLPQYLSKDCLYVSGLIAGDGDLRKKGASISVRLSNSEEALHGIFQQVLTKEFNLSFDVQKGGEKRPMATRTNSKLFGELLLSLGVYISPKSEKIFLSNTLLHLSDELVAEYLAGLFDADGSINKRITKGSDCIDLTSCSEKLIRGVQLTLLRFGMHATIRKRAPSTGKIVGKLDNFVLEIRSGKDIALFQKNIPLRHPQKKKKLFSLKIRTENTNVDILHGVGLKLKPLLRKAGYNLNVIGWHEHLSRKGLQNILQKVSFAEKEYFEKLAYSDIFWDEIKEITMKPSSYDFVYDLTVKDAHNFVVDGVLVHNTASVVKDEFLKGWALEAGALVLANKGMVCIDEMDKMSDEDTSAMHEALEQQQVSISKANIQATLRCQTTVLAAANPKFGRFDPYELIAKQINMPEPLINRFDLIFPMKDLPNPANDEIMASFILNLHRGVKNEKDESLFDTAFIRKYIAYAKQYYFPEINDDAMHEIKQYYVQMRNQGGEGSVSAVPISARQLEALVRLTEASARVRLSNVADKYDAKRAIDLVHHCLLQIGVDPETGKFDIDRITTGVTAKQRNNISIVKEVISELEKAIGKIIPEDDIIRESEIKGISEDKVSEILSKLMRQGDLFSPKNGFISKVR